MTDRNVTCIVEAANKAAAVAIGVAYGDGTGTFSVPLSSNPSETNPANATHWGMSGSIPEAEVAAFEASVDPMINVTDNDTGGGFFQIIGSRSPQLYIVNEPA
jgi:hypothetical protein